MYVCIYLSTYLSTYWLVAPSPNHHIAKWFLQIRGSEQLLFKDGVQVIPKWFSVESCKTEAPNSYFLMTILKSFQSDFPSVLVWISCFGMRLEAFGRPLEGDCQHRSKKIWFGLDVGAILKGFGRPEGRLGEPFEVNFCNFALFESISKCDVFLRAFGDHPRG